MPIDETKNKRLVIVVSQETAKEIEALAKKDRRPLSAYVRNVLEDHVSAAKSKAFMGKLTEEGSGAMGIFPPPEL
jgi:predicted DNA-binding protein